MQLPWIEHEPPPWKGGILTIGPQKLELWFDGKNFLFLHIYYLSQFSERDWPQDNVAAWRGWHWLVNGSRKTEDKVNLRSVLVFKFFRRDIVFIVPEGSLWIPFWDPSGSCQNRGAAWCLEMIRWYTKILEKLIYCWITEKKSFGQGPGVLFKVGKPEDSVVLEILIHNWNFHGLETGIGLLSFDMSMDSVASSLRIWWDLTVTHGRNMDEDLVVPATLFRC